MSSDIRWNDIRHNESRCRHINKILTHNSVHGCRFHLQQGARGFAYLASSDAFELDSADDAAAFKQTLAAMKVIGLTREQRMAVLQLVAAILHLGNIRFLPSDQLATPCPGTSRVSVLNRRWLFAELFIRYARILIDTHWWYR